MRKWRPAHRCLYVIPEIHGNIESLKIIFNRILPLRFSEKQYDKIILLGDYIDKGNYSNEVIELILEAKNEFEDQIICLKGNHEQLLLNALTSEENYQSWLMQGGNATISSYLLAKNITLNHLPFSRVKDIIPLNHIDFLNSLPTHLVLGKYIFFHGGINLINPEATTDTIFMFDTSSSYLYKKYVKNNNDNFKNQLIYVGAHNFKNKLPFICDKYLMLGGSAPQNLILFELNSMKCAMIKNGKSRIYKHNYITHY